MHGKRTTNHSRLGHLTNQSRVDSQKGGFGEIEFIEKEVYSSVPLVYFF